MSEYLDKEYKIKNIYFQKKTDSINMALVLLRFNISKSTITNITNLDSRTIDKVKDNNKKYLNAFPNKYPKTSQKVDRTVSPTSILKTQKLHYAYNVLMLLYVRFHSGDPNYKIDVDAFLKAWCVYHSIEHHYNDVNIHDFWTLCNFLGIDALLDEDLDGGRVLYSNEYHAFYYHSNRSRLAEGETNYQKLKNVKDVIKELKTRKDTLNSNNDEYTALAS